MANSTQRKLHRQELVNYLADHLEHVIARLPVLFRQTVVLHHLLEGLIPCLQVVSLGEYHRQDSDRDNAQGEDDGQNVEPPEGTRGGEEGVGLVAATDQRHSEEEGQGTEHDSQHSID